MTALADYRVAADLALNLEIPFDALVMAGLLRSTPGAQRDRVTAAFPSLAAEVAARRVTTDGRLPHEIDLARRHVPRPAPAAPKSIREDEVLVAAAERFGDEIDPGPAAAERIAWPYAGTTRPETVS